MRGECLTDRRLFDGYLTELSWAFYVGISFAFAHLVWQITTLDTDDVNSCLQRFKSNRNFGLVIFVSIIAGRIF